MPMENSTILPTLKPGVIGLTRSVEINSKLAEAVIGFGKGMKRGTDKKVQVKQWDGATSGDQFCGIAIYSIEGNVDNYRYDAKNSVGELVKGALWVQVSNLAGAVAFAPGDKLTVMPDGNFSKQITVAGTSGTYGVQLDNVTVHEGGAKGEYALIEINQLGTPAVIQL